MFNSGNFPIYHIKRVLENTLEILINLNQECDYYGNNHKLEFEIAKIEEVLEKIKAIDGTQ